MDYQICAAAAVTQVQRPNLPVAEACIMDRQILDIVVVNP